MVVTPSGEGLGARVDQIDLSRPLSPESFSEIEQLLGQYGVLCFPAQQLTTLQLKAFSQNFGTLEINVAILYQQPGKCPLCGMALVPVTAEQLAQIQPGGIVDHYTCPMPEHADVQQDKPGKCPKCGMTLIPVMKPR